MEDMQQSLQSISLSVSTYNWPAALELCLQSILKQSYMPDEVLVADDGSGSETMKLVKQYQELFTVPLRHIWQADEGFQLARIRNKTISAAKGKYIIQIDGDVILHHHFIRDHIQFSRPYCYVTGSRVLLNESVSLELLRSRNINMKLLRRNGKNFFNGLHFPWLSNLLAHRYKKDPFDVKGCNMAFWKSDLEKVNGYNEAFKGWGREDSELSIRLMNAGVKKRFLKGGGIMFHLNHQEVSRNMEQQNSILLEQTKRDNIRYIDKGLSQYQ